LLGQLHQEKCNRIRGTHEEMRNAYKILVGTFEAKRAPEGPMKTTFLYWFLVKLGKFCRVIWIHQGKDNAMADLC
jgi:hypothetical protein